MLGDRDLNVVLSPLPRNKRAKNPRQEEPSELPPAAAARLASPPLPPHLHPPNRPKCLYLPFGFTWSVDTTSRTPSVSIASTIALLMCSDDATAPDRVTTRQSC